MAAIQTVGVELDRIQENSLDYVRNDVPGALGIIALPTLSSIESADELPSGTVICVSKSAQLDPAVLPKDMFATLALYPLLTPNDTAADLLDDNYFRRKMSVEVSRAISAKFGVGPSLANAATRDAIGAQLGSDLRSWKPKLGNGWWSICKHETELYSAQYYIAVYVPRTGLSDDFLNLASEIAQRDALQISGEQSSFNDLLKRDEYSVAERLAKRNNAKIAYIVAKMFGVNIKHTIDTSSPIDGDTFVQPKIGVASHMSLFNHLDSVSIVVKNDRGQRKIPAVAIYSGSGSLNKSIGGMVLPLSPRLGLDFYPDIRRVYNTVQNVAANAIPLGRKVLGVRDLSQPELRFNEHHVFWNSKRSKSVHPKMKQMYRTDSDQDVTPFLPNKSEERKLRLSHVIVHLGEDPINA